MVLIRIWYATRWERSIVKPTEWGVKPSGDGAVILQPSDTNRTPDHSMIAMENWGAAGFKEQDAQKKAVAAKEAYKDALHLYNYGI